jgi:RimJ/RimL family protein N-acetyltransferase
MPLPDHDISDELTSTRRWWNRLRAGAPPRTSPVAPADQTAIGEIICEGSLVRLRRHVPANREAFQRWYADPEIARLLRHDLQPLSHIQSLVYFDTVILPSSARGLTCAIHDRETDHLIGTTGLTEVGVHAPGSCYFRILIGEHEYWNRGCGTEATRLMMDEAFTRHGLETINLVVFDYNERAQAVYARVGFRQVGEHTEWPELGGHGLHVIEMRLRKSDFTTARSDSGPFG